MYTIWLYENVKVVLTGAEAMHNPLFLGVVETPLGVYYFRAQPTPTGYRVSLERNGVLQHKYQGSTLNLGLEVAAATKF